MSDQHRGAAHNYYVSLSCLPERLVFGIRLYREFHCLKEIMGPPSLPVREVELAGLPSAILQMPALFMPSK
jgi:hypothetical protein